MGTDTPPPTLSMARLWQLVTGTPITDGPYQLAYNPDGNGLFILEYDGEDSAMEIAFTCVEQFGQRAYSFHLDNERFVVSITDLDSDRQQLIRALNTIASVTTL